jgi:hypothetical protein
MNRQQDVTRRVVIDLKKVEGEIPRNTTGDPNFIHLQSNKQADDDNDDMSLGVLDVFTPEQVVALVNRALYQMEYSRTSHRERSQKLRDQERPVKEAFKRLFPTTSWAQATEEQIKAAVQEVYKPKGEQHEG